MVSKEVGMRTTSYPDKDQVSKLNSKLKPTWFSSRGDKGVGNNTLLAFKSPHQN